MSIPQYMLLYEEMKAFIISGHYKAGEKLPSKRKLAESLKRSVLTVEAAYGQLMAEGYIFSVEKKGYFVEAQVEILPVGQSMPLHLEEDIEKPYPYMYRFQTNVVDTSLFPNSTWKKLSREVLSENHDEMLNVIHPQGLYELRVEIAKYLRVNRAISIDPRQIIIGSGSTALISLLVEMIGRSHKYAIENPSYPKIYHLFKGNDVKLYPISLDDSGIKMTELIKTNASVVHITPSHQFPMGITMPIQRRNELINWANLDEDRYIIEDDYDSEFRYQGKPIPALKSLDYNDKVIYMNSFTKTLAPSFRMGYIVLPYQLMKTYLSISSFHGCSVPNFEQYIMHKFMRGGYFERHINRMKHHYRQKLERLMSVTSTYKDIELIGYDSGLHLIMEVMVDKTGQELVELAKKHMIEVHAVERYDHLKHEKIHTHPKIVIGYSGIPLEEIEKATHALMTSWQLKRHY